MCAQSEARRAKHARDHAQEEEARAKTAQKEAEDSLYAAVKEAEARGMQTRAELGFVKEELQKTEQQRVRRCCIHLLTMARGHRTHMAVL